MFLGERRLPLCSSRQPCREPVAKTDRVLLKCSRRSGRLLQASGLCAPEGKYARKLEQAAFN